VETATQGIIVVRTTASLPLSPAQSRSTRLSSLHNRLRRLPVRLTGVKDASSSIVFDRIKVGSADLA